MSAVKKIPHVVELNLDVTPRWRGAADSEKLIFCKDADPVSSIDLILQQGFEQVIQEDHPYTPSDINTAALMLADSELFFRAPVMSILNPANADKQLENRQYLMNISFERIYEKRDVLAKAEEVFQKLEVNSTIQTDALISIDELFTNAVYNAPEMDLENTRPGYSREDDTASMPVGYNGRIFIGADQEKFVVGCHDPFGTLNPHKLLMRIKNCYETGVAANMKMVGGGAGIGSYLVFQSAASYYVAVKERQSTLVCFSMPIKMSSRQRLELPKNIHLIYKK